MTMLAAERTVTPNDLRALLEYSPDTGDIFWKPRPRNLFATERAYSVWNTRYAHMSALNTPDGQGYLRGEIFSKQFKAHRVAWALVYGEWPDGVIDHINGVKDDNRIANLRVVSDQESQRNKPRQKNNTSGVAGVRPSRGKWRASICTTNLGTFERYDDAVAARKLAEKEMGFHANHGRV